jgi:hypothetical protein
MPQQLDREYIAARQRHAEEMARTSPDPVVARVHQEFADRYALVLAQTDLQQGG